MTRQKPPPNAVSDNPFAALAALRDQLPAAPPAAAPTPQAKPAPSLFEEKVVARKERKGHGGKTVTVITGVRAAVREQVMGEMKRALGTGARIEDDAIVVAGDLVDRVVAFLEKKGAKKVVRGS